MSFSRTEYLGDEDLLVGGTGSQLSTVVDSERRKGSFWHASRPNGRGSETSTPSATCR